MAKIDLTKYGITGTTFVLRSRKEKIDISKELISFIKGCEALDYKIN